MSASSFLASATLTIAYDCPLASIIIDSDLALAFIIVTSEFALALAIAISVAICYSIIAAFFLAFA